jgi:hypothetical protein
MTWHYQVDSGTLKVWDHTADPSAGDSATHIRNLPSLASERERSDQAHVHDLMASEYRDEVTPGNAPVHSQKAVEINEHRIQSDIERWEG